MKNTMTRLAAVLTVAFFAIAPARALTYNMTFDGAVFDLKARVVTNAANLVTSMTGFLTGPTGAPSAITAVISTTNTTYSSLWTWDNIYKKTGINISSDGLLFQMANGDVANYYRDKGRYFLSVVNPATNNYTYWTNADRGVHTSQPIPLPPAAWLLGTGLLGLAKLKRKQKKVVPAIGLEPTTP